VTFLILGYKNSADCVRLSYRFHHTNNKHHDVVKWNLNFVYLTWIFSIDISTVCNYIYRLIAQLYRAFRFSETQSATAYQSSSGSSHQTTSGGKYLIDRARATGMLFSHLQLRIPAKNKNVRYIAVLLACKCTYIVYIKKNNNNKNGNKTWTNKYANNSSPCARASYFFSSRVDFHASSGRSMRSMIDRSARGHYL